MATCTELCGTFSCVLGWLNDHAAAVATLVSAGIAALAIRFALRQNRIAHEHNRLSVRPRLVLWVEWIVSDRKNPGARLIVRNFGLGPAFLREDPVIRIDGRQVDVHDRAAVIDALLSLFGENWSEAHLLFELEHGGGEYAIPKDGGLPLIEVEVDPSLVGSYKETLLSKVDVTVPYWSPYNEHLVAETGPQTL